MQNDQVLVVGDSMLDRYWEGNVERISPEAPVPVLKFANEWQRPGGAANVAVNLLALGSFTTLATLLGRDEAGDSLAHTMEAQGVQLHAVRSAAVTTTQKIRTVCRRHQMLRIDIEHPPPSDAVQSLEDLVEGLLPEHPWVILSDYQKGALAHCERLIERARQHRCRVMVDPKGIDFDRYRGAWLLKPNEKEAAAVVGSWDDEEGFADAMTSLRARLDIQHLLVTRGERGMSLFSADGPAVHVPTAAREVFDVSGAGDTVLAALASYLASGNSLHEAMHHANLAAGLAVAKFGTAAVTRTEIQKAQAAALAAAS